MCVINHLGFWPAWFIPTHQNSKLLLISRYTTVIHILFLKLIINNISNKVKARLLKITLLRHMLKQISLLICN